MTQNYNAPISKSAVGSAATVTSSIDAGVDGKQDNAGQVNTEYWDRVALYETRRERYFAPLAEVTAMPKHYGKTIKKYHIMPLLDDRNLNDQGLNSDGSSTLNNGNLYGSSKDIGVIAAKLPSITENGGRVNRVGFSRQLITGTMENYGIFHEFTEDYLNFDSMADLYSHLSRELVSGAVQMTEAMIQMDLIAAAGVVRYSGGATSKGTMTAETSGSESVVTYADLQTLSITLDNNRSPKSMKMIKGSQGFNTTVVDNGRLLYIGSELIPTMTKMQDHFGNPAFVSVEHYGYAGTYKEGTNMIHGEIGKIGQFRIIVVPEMLYEAAAGATATAGNTGYRFSDLATDKYDIFPLLTIGSESFTTIGFQTGGGANFKFKIITRMPGEIVTLDDPYAKTGFSSLQFWYGFMPMRAERIAVQWSLAEL